MVAQVAQIRMTRRKPSKIKAFRCTTFKKINSYKVVQVAHFL